MQKFLSLYFAKFSSARSAMAERGSWAGSLFEGNRYVRLSLSIFIDDIRTSTELVWHQVDKLNFPIQLVLRLRSYVLDCVATKFDSIKRSAFTIHVPCQCLLSVSWKILSENYFVSVAIFMDALAHTFTRRNYLSTRLFANRINYSYLANKSSVARAHTPTRISSSTQHSLRHSDIFANENNK